MYLFVKRILDIIVSIVMVVLLSPLLFILFICIKLDSQGPAIFKQKRLGKSGKIFNIYKFRTMYLNSEKQGVYELKNDKRITKIGRILRKTSLDELPQLFNIIKGEMSIIGPRPTLTYHPWVFDDYTSFQLQRFRVRPGVTGWAQVNGRKNVVWEDRIKLDVFYVHNISLKLDLRILFKTIAKVLLNSDNYNEIKTGK